MSAMTPDFASSPRKTTESQMLAVSRIGTKCRVLGPGRRCVVWFHGCPRSCEGCIAKEMNDAPEEQRHAPEALAAMLAEAHPEGLTLSGGDPFYQSRGALGAFLRAFRKLCPACGVICYTGYRYEELLRDDDARVCLEFVDVLIDGPYVRELDDGMGLRGSANQRVLFLTGRYASERDRFVSGERRVQLEVTLDGAVLMSGVPGPGFIDGLQRELRNRSAELRF